MNVIEAAEAILKLYPQLTYEIFDHEMTGEPGITAKPDGECHISVRLEYSLSGEGFDVYFDGWHRYEVRHPLQALHYFSWGLTDLCRLRVEEYGGTESRWAAEFKVGDDWEVYGRASRLFVPFWRKKTVKYLQNPLIKENHGLSPQFSQEECESAIIRLLRTAGIRVTKTKSKWYRTFVIFSATSKSHAADGVIYYEKDGYVDVAIHYGINIFRKGDEYFAQGYGRAFLSIQEARDFLDRL